jgi:hypothetical protein
LAFAKKLQEDSQRFAKDPKDGKEAIMERAKKFEEVRNHSLEQSHSFDNASVALQLGPCSLAPAAWPPQLGIVLATASVITHSALLIRFAILMGAIGVALGVLGMTMPELGAF